MTEGVVGCVVGCVAVVLVVGYVCRVVGGG